MSNEISVFSFKITKKTCIHCRQEKRSNSFVNGGPICKYCITHRINKKPSESLSDPQTLETKFISSFSQLQLDKDSFSQQFQDYNKRLESLELKLTEYNDSLSQQSQDYNKKLELLELKLTEYNDSLSQQLHNHNLIIDDQKKTISLLSNDLDDLKNHPLFKEAEGHRKTIEDLKIINQTLKIDIENRSHSDTKSTVKLRTLNIEKQQLESKLQSLELECKSLRTKQPEPTSSRPVSPVKIRLPSKS